MEWIAYLVAAVFSLMGIGCIFLVVLGLPGTWIMIVLAFLIEVLDHYYLETAPTQTFSWWLLGVCVLLGAVGELLEFFAGMFGAKKGGSSKYGMIGTFVGGLLGALLGIFIPIPVIGSLIGALLGTFVGAIIGEVYWAKVAVRDSFRPAAGATIGKILGTLSKLPIAFTVWVALTVSAFLL